MDVLLTARHFDLSDSLREYTERRLRRLHKFNGRLSRLEVTLVEEKREKRIEARGSIEGDADVYAEAGGQDFRTAVNRVTGKLERQLKRRHARRREHQGPRLGEDIPPAPDLG